MYSVRFGLAAFSVILLSAAGGAAAQDRGSVSDRLDRVERNLNELQRQVYRNAVGGGPPPSAPTGADGGAAGTGALDVQIRMDQVESKMRTLTGQLEEIQYGITQLKGRLDKLQNDDEVRFQQLEGGAPRAAAGPPPDAYNGGAEPPPGPAMAAAGEALEAPPPPSEAPPATQNVLPDGSAQMQYNFAFGLVRDHDFKGAEQAFKAFLKVHPTDTLAGNAQYWLGEIYMERSDFKAASAAFADSYQRAPQGPKAPNDLLKLGDALGRQGRKQEACFSLAKLDRDFPAVLPSVKDEEKSVRQRLGC
jgi:tol-pal system protein YbgF